MNPLNQKPYSYGTAECTFSTSSSDSDSIEEKKKPRKKLEKKTSFLDRLSSSEKTESGETSGTVKSGNKNELTPRDIHNLKYGPGFAFNTVSSESSPSSLSSKSSESSSESDADDPFKIPEEKRWYFGLQKLPGHPKDHLRIDRDRRPRELTRASDTFIWVDVKWAALNLRLTGRASPTVSEVEAAFAARMSELSKMGHAPWELAILKNPLVESLKIMNNYLNKADNFGKI